MEPGAKSLPYTVWTVFGSDPNYKKRHCYYSQLAHVFTIYVLSIQVTKVMLYSPGSAPQSGNSFRLGRLKRETKQPVEK